MNQQNPSNAAKKNRFVAFAVHAALVVFSLAFSLLVLEGGTRLWLHLFSPNAGQRIANIRESVARRANQKPLFLPHPYLSYYPSDVVLTDSGCVIHGKAFDFEPPENTLRIACLGGSTTMRAYPSCFPQALTPIFPDTNIEVMDWGCSGWTLLESTINYCIRGRLFHPDVVIVHHGINDIAPRIRPDYRFDYSHFRRSAQNFEIPAIHRWMNFSVLWTWAFVRLDAHPANLDASTVIPYTRSNADSKKPAQDRTIAYREAADLLDALCRADGTSLILAGMIYQPTRSLTPSKIKLIEEHNTIFRDCAASSDCLYVDAQKNFSFRPEYFKDEAHLIPWGDQIKANLLVGAVAKVKGVTPRIWIAADAFSTEDLVGETDWDDPDNRELVIHWDRVPKQTREIQIRVGVNGEPEKVLARISDTNQLSFSWKPGTQFVQSDFQNGPQFGESYLFSVWFDHEKKIMPLVTYDWVSFQMAPDVNVEP